MITALYHIITVAECYIGFSDSSQEIDEPRFANGDAKRQNIRHIVAQSSKNTEPCRGAIPLGSPNI
jgi:hypothetical protein